MTKFFLKYNPFTVISEMTIDGSEIHQNNTMYSWRNERLQVWLDRLLPTLVETCNEDDIEITFHGTQLDYEDVQEHINNYISSNPEKRVHLDYIQAKGIDDRIAELNELFDYMQKESPFEDLKSDEIKTNFDKALNSEFEVSVIATMSSGKSTLINALLGKELMPSKNEACTATIVKIKDVDGMDSFTAVCRDEDENEIIKFDNIDKKILEKANNDEQISYVDIEGDIPFITSKRVQLVMIDTPGPNNSRNDDHRKKTYSIIKEKNKPIVLYVLNATQLGINDDNHLLGVVAEAMKKGGKQSKDRFIFVVNKMDAFDPDDESIEGAIDQVRKYLKTHGIDNPNLYPISAETAKIIRLYQNGVKLRTKQESTLTEGMKLFNNPLMHLSDYASLSNKNKEIINNDLFKYTEDNYAKTLIHTGIPAVELAINEYLDKYAITIKIETAVNTFIKSIEEKDYEKKLREELVKNENKRKELHNLLLKVQNQLQEGNSALEFKNKISNLDMTEKAIEDIETLRAKAYAELRKNNISKSKMTVHEASLYVNNFVKEINELRCDIQTDLEKILDDSITNNCIKFITEYEAHIKSLIDDNEINVKEFDSNSSLNFITVNLVEIGHLVHNFKYKEKVKIGEKWVDNPEREGFIGFFKVWEPKKIISDIYEDKEFVDTAKINEKINSIFMVFVKNIEAAKAVVDDQANKFKTFFSNELDKLDNLLKKKICNLQQLTSDKLTIEKSIEANRQKDSWLKEFKDKLNNLIEI